MKKQLLTIDAYKTYLPTVATEAVLQQMEGAGARFNKIGIVMAQGPKQQFAATNSDTPYIFVILDLRDGPMVKIQPRRLNAASSAFVPRSS